jgi:hypothetical protein
MRGMNWDVLWHKNLVDVADKCEWQTQSLYDATFKIFIRLAWFFENFLWASKVIFKSLKDENVKRKC